MKKDIVHLVFALLALVFSCALEELVPPVLGIGIPVLLSSAVYCAVNRKPVEGLLFALAAGAAEDSLASLPLAASVSFFVVTCSLLKWFKIPPVAAVVAYPLYQFWIWVWLGAAMQGNILLRMLAAFSVGAVTLSTVWVLLRWLDGKAAIDEK